MYATGEPKTRLARKQQQTQEPNKTKMKNKIDTFSKGEIYTECKHHD
jgi:hypothetical protein